MTPAVQTMEPVQKATENMMKACEEMSTLAREQIDATMKSASAMSKGLEEINRNTSNLIQETLSRSVAAGKTMMSAKSAKEIVDMQTEYMKECFDFWVAGTGKISEISARMTQDVMGPMAEHTNHAMSKLAQKTRSAA